LAEVDVDAAEEVLSVAVGRADEFEAVVVAVLRPVRVPEVAVVTEPSVPVRVTSAANVIAARIGVAVPAFRGAGVLGVKSGMLLQF
jgi:hypothetical protein